MHTIAESAIIRVLRTFLYETDEFMNDDLQAYIRDHADESDEELLNYIKEKFLHSLGNYYCNGEIDGEDELEVLGMTQDELESGTIEEMSEYSDRFLTIIYEYFDAHWATRVLAEMQ